MLHRARRARRAGARRPTRRSTSSASSPRSTTFMTVDLSAFYFDIRKDALYCDPASSPTRKAALTVIDQLFRCPVPWLAPMLSFTAEEAWLSRYPGDDASVHLELFPELPAAWRDEALAEKWRKVRDGAPRRHRRARGRARREAHRLVARGGAASSTSPTPICSPRWSSIDLAEVCDHLGGDAGRGRGPGRRVPPRRRRRASRSCRGSPKARKCARSWKISPARRLRSGLSRRDAARRAGAARMGRDAQGGREGGGVTWPRIPLRPAHPLRADRGARSSARSIRP